MHRKIVGLDKVSPDSSPLVIAAIRYSATTKPMKATNNQFLLGLHLYVNEASFDSVRLFTLRNEPFLKFKIPQKKFSQCGNASEAVFHLYTMTNSSVDDSAETLPK